ncbi:MAG: hypothetical protein ACOYEB_06915 [Enterococcus lemanii]
MFKQNKDNQKNEVRNQGNRRYSMLLMALLFIGMATYGTYAYFTDSTSVNGNIKLTTGTVRLEQLDAERTQWEYAGVNGKISPKSRELAFDNVQPGDKFTKTVKVKYTGSLNAEVTTTIKDDYKNLASAAGITLDIQVNGKENGEIAPDTTFTVTLTAELPLGKEEKHSDTTGNRNNATATDKVFELDKFTDAVTISVRQLGSPEE